MVARYFANIRGYDNHTRKMINAAMTEPPCHLSSEI